MYIENEILIMYITCILYILLLPNINFFIYSLFLCGHSPRHISPNRNLRLCYLSVRKGYSWFD